MATIRALSVALLLALCFAACACAPAERMPKNRYISYVPERRGQNGTGHGGGNRRGCSAMTKRGCGPVPPGGTTVAVGSESKHLALEKAGAKMEAPGSKSGYISPAAISRDKLCGRFGCPSRP